MHSLGFEVVILRFYEEQGVLREKENADTLRDFPKEHGSRILKTVIHLGAQKSASPWFASLSENYCSNLILADIQIRSKMVCHFSSWPTQELNLRSTKPPLHKSLLRCSRIHTMEPTPIYRANSVPWLWLRRNRDFCPNRGQILNKTQLKSLDPILRGWVK